MTLKIAIPTCLALLSTALSSSPIWAQESIAQTDARVQLVYETLYAGNCRSLTEGETPNTPTIYELTFNYGEEDYPPRPFRVYEYLCFEGPYNQGYVYFGANDSQEVSTMGFATPNFHVAYENDDPYGAVTDISVNGWTTSNQIINAHFDKKTKTLRSFSKWRGPADAFTSGRWIFSEGEFILEFFEVDAAFDGERKPMVIYGDDPATDHDN